MSTLMMEAAMAGRRLQELPEHMRCEREDPPCFRYHPGRVGDGGTDASNHKEPLTGSDPTTKSGQGYF